MTQIQLTNAEAVPLLWSLIESGRTELATRQMTHMAKLADAVGKELEIVVLPHDELTGQFQILLVVVGRAEPLVHLQPISSDEIEAKVQEMEQTYPAATTVYV